MPQVITPQRYDYVVGGKLGDRGTIKRYEPSRDLWSQNRYDQSQYSISSGQDTERPHYAARHIGMLFVMAGAVVGISILMVPVISLIVDTLGSLLSRFG